VLYAKRDPAVFDARVVGRRDIVGSVLGHDYQVCMRHTITVYHHPNPLRLEVGPHPSANALRDHHHVSGDGVLDIGKVVDVLSRYNGALASSEWS
jgi:hypothetical protein